MLGHSPKKILSARRSMNLKRVSLKREAKTNETLRTLPEGEKKG